VVRLSSCETLSTVRHVDYGGFLLPEMFSKKKNHLIKSIFSKKVSLKKVYLKKIYFGYKKYIMIYKK